MKDWLESLKFTATPNLDECIEYLGETFPLLYEFKDTPQDKEWHAEGNVHIHTDMVLTELYKLLADDEFQHVTGKRRQAVILGTLLHDIAKPMTTRESDRDGKLRIVAPRHEEKGRSYCAFRIMELGLPYEVVNMVLYLIGEHNKPKRVVRDGKRGGFLHLSRLVDLELLYLVEVADMRGRTCDDFEENLEFMELFRMYAQEFDSWQQDPYLDWVEKISTQSGYEGALLDVTLSRSMDDLESELIFTPEEAVAKSFKFRDGFPEVVICCGLSGVGKSHYIEKELADYKVVSLDSLREELFGKAAIQGNFGKVFQLAKERLKESLRRKEKVVWDATGLRRDFRKQIVDLCHNYNGLATILFFHTSIEYAETGNKNRQRKVADGILAKQVNSFEFPVHTEADRLLVVGEKLEELMKVGFY